MDFKKITQLAGQNNLYITIKDNNQEIIFANHPNAYYFSNYDSIDNTYVKELNEWYCTISFIYQMDNQDYYISIYNPITNYIEKIEEQNLEIERLKYDHLTHLYNRHGFQEQFLNIVNKKQHYVLGIADIDLFKNINDQYGHSIGDMILKSFSKLFLEKFKNNLCGRYGGEEFIVIFSDTTLAEAKKKANEFRKLIEEKSFLCQNNEIKITISFGLAPFTLNDEMSSEEKFREILEKADKSLYCSKNNGRNRVSDCLSLKSNF